MDPNCDIFTLGTCPCSLDEQDLNIVYVLDSSTTISDDEWNALQERIANIVEFTFGGNDVRYLPFIFVFTKHMYQSF
jgi:hypothetical protein